MPPNEEVTDARVSVLEANVGDLRGDMAEVKDALKLYADRPTREDARSIARAWTLAGVSLTAAFSSIIALSLAAMGVT